MWPSQGHDETKPSPENLCLVEGSLDMNYHHPYKWSHLNMQISRGDKNTGDWNRTVWLSHGHNKTRGSDQIVWLSLGHKNTGVNHHNLCFSEGYRDRERSSYDFNGPLISGEETTMLKLIETTALFGKTRFEVMDFAGNLLWGFSGIRLQFYCRHQVFEISNSNGVVIGALKCKEVHSDRVMWEWSLGYERQKHYIFETSMRSPYSKRGLSVITPDPRFGLEPQYKFGLDSYDGSLVLKEIATQSTVAKGIYKRSRGLFIPSETIVNIVNTEGSEIKVLLVAAVFVINRYRDTEKTTVPTKFLCA